MLHTAEVRWFFTGELPVAARDWFCQDARPPEAQPARVDHYLPLADAALGVKVREGRVEIKQRQSAPRRERYHAEAVGYAARWAKWSFGMTADANSLVSLATARATWIAVRKRRWSRQYRIADYGTLSAVPADKVVAWGCDVELTAVEIAGIACWTLGFEAAGPDATLDKTLRRVAGHVFAQTPPPFPLMLEAAHSYPAWLQWLMTQHQGQVVR